MSRHAGAILVLHRAGMIHNEHGHGLAKDLERMEALVARRRALKWLAGAGAAAVVACGSERASGGAAGGGRTASCVADPAETNGPFPADGTNASSGSTANVLTAAGIVRSDIRSSFLGSSTAVAAGVPLTLTLTVVDVNPACAPLAGHAVYIWCCDREGRYSLYTAADESYLRGVQVTDADGQVTFAMIFPACYDGRWPHIHFEIFPSLPRATGGRHASLVSQLAMPAAICSAVYADTAAYPSSALNFSRVSLFSDNVFGDGDPAQVARQTPDITGDAASGYVATATIGLARQGIGAVSIRRH